MKCVLCDNEILPQRVSGWAGGNNPWPLADLDDGPCCDSCNDNVVACRIRLKVGPKNRLYQEAVVREYRREYGESQLPASGLLYRT